MILNFAPQRGPDIDIRVDGDTLTVDGTTLDFGPLAEGDILPAAATGCDWLTGNIAREAGQIVLTLILPHGPDATRDRRFPDPVTLTSGRPSLPPYN